MAFKISFQNSAGEIDSREVQTQPQVKAALLEVIENCPDFHAGDKIEIIETEA